jgi:hypothetical protein
MQIPIVLDNAKAGLAEIGGEFLAGSGFENEEPESDFVAATDTPTSSRSPRRI